MTILISCFTNISPRFPGLCPSSLPRFATGAGKRGELWAVSSGEGDAPAVTSDRTAAIAARINAEGIRVVQVERQSAQIVELIELLEGDLVMSLADHQIDVEEAARLRFGVQQLHQVAMDHDECSAIGIAILRTGLDSRRTRDLLGSRNTRLPMPNDPPALAAAV